VSLIWVLPAAVGAVGATAVIVAARNAVRSAERLRVSLSRLTELRAPVRRLGDDVQGLTMTLDELRRRS
jgi:cob(I)alamin adenosyltransferase